MTSPTKPLIRVWMDPESGKCASSLEELGSIFPDQMATVIKGRSIEMIRLDQVKPLVDALDQSIRQWESYVTDLGADDLKDIHHAEADELRKCINALKNFEGVFE